jgi:uncharacterized protein
MNNPMQQHGAFSWCELMTTDLNAAKAFYQELFGWQMEPGPVQGIEYTMASAGGQQVGGLMTIPETMPKGAPSWGAYVTVENVDATVKKVEELGGKVLMQPDDIPEVGRFAFVQDPQGATISVITYSNA